MSEFKECLKWDSLHKSGLFSMEIRLHSKDSQFMNGGIFNTYLNVFDPVIWRPERKVIKSRIIDFIYSNENLLNDLPWNGDITFFEKAIISDNSFKKRRSFKVGDDYAHSWDIDKDHSLEEMKFNIENVGDKFYEILKRNNILSHEEQSK